MLIVFAISDLSLLLTLSDVADLIKILGGASSARIRLTTSYVILISPLQAFMVM